MIKRIVCLLIVITLCVCQPECAADSVATQTINPFIAASTDEAVLQKSVTTEIARTNKDFIYRLRGHLKKVWGLTILMNFFSAGYSQSAGPLSSQAIDSLTCITLDSIKVEGDTARYSLVRWGDDFIISHVMDLPVRERFLYPSDRGSLAKPHELTIDLDLGISDQVFDEQGVYKQLVDMERAHAQTIETMYNLGFLPGSFKVMEDDYEKMRYGFCQQLFAPQIGVEYKLGIGVRKGYTLGDFNAEAGIYQNFALLASEPDVVNEVVTFFEKYVFRQLTDERINNTRSYPAFSVAYTGGNEVWEAKLGQFIVDNPEIYFRLSRTLPKALTTFVGGVAVAPSIGFPRNIVPKSAMSLSLSVHQPLGKRFLAHGMAGLTFNSPNRGAYSLQGKTAHAYSVGLQYKLSDRLIVTSQVTSRSVPFYFPDYSWLSNDANTFMVGIAMTNFRSARRERQEKRARVMTSWVFPLPPANENFGMGEAKKGLNLGNWNPAPDFSTMVSGKIRIKGRKADGSSRNDQARTNTGAYVTEPLALRAS
jgi:hypothetical protein